MYIYEHTNVMLFYYDKMKIMIHKILHTPHISQGIFVKFDEKTSNSILLKSGVHFNYAEYTEE